MLKKLILCLSITVPSLFLYADSELLETYKTEQTELLEEISEKRASYEELRERLNNASEKEPLSTEEQQEIIKELEELNTFFESTNKRLKKLATLIKKHQTANKNSPFITAEKAKTAFTITSLLGAVGAIGYGIKKLIDYVRIPSEKNSKTASHSEKEPEWHESFLRDRESILIEKYIQEPKNEKSPESNPEGVPGSNVAHNTQKTNKGAQLQEKINDEENYNNKVTAFIKKSAVEETETTQASTQKNSPSWSSKIWQIIKNFPSDLYNAASDGTTEGIPKEIREECNQLLLTSGDQPIELSKDLSNRLPQQPSYALVSQEKKPWYSFIIPKSFYNKYAQEMRLQRAINAAIKEEWKNKRKKEKELDTTVLSKKNHQPLTFINNAKKHIILMPNENNSHYALCYEKTSNQINQEKSILLLTYKPEWHKKNPRSEKMDPEEESQNNEKKSEDEKEENPEQEKMRLKKERQQKRLEEELYRGYTYQEM